MKFTVLTRRFSLLSIAASVGLLTAMVGNSAFAVLLAYDPFLTTGDNNAIPAGGQYFKGSDDAGTNPLGGQNPIIGPTAFYTGPWIQSGGDAQSVKGGSLTYPNFPSLKGRIQEEVQFSCCSFGRTGRAIADVTGSGENGLGVGRDAHTFYESFLINFGHSGTDANPADFGKHGYESWNGGVGDSFLAVDLFVNSFSGVTDLQLNVTTPSGTQSQTVAGNLDLPDLASVNGGVHLVVMKYEFDPTNPDVVTMYLDPTDSIEANWTPGAQVSAPNSDLVVTHHSTISQFQFSGGGHVPGAFDEVRWGQTFADVTPFGTPEPGSLILMLLGSMGLAAVRRR